MKATLINFQRQLIRHMVEEKREKNTQNERTTNINKNKTSIILGGNMIKNVKE